MIWSLKICPEEKPTSWAAVRSAFPDSTRRRQAIAGSGRGEDVPDLRSSAYRGGASFSARMTLVETALLRRVRRFFR